MAKQRNHRRLGILVVISVAMAGFIIFVVGGRSLFRETYDFETYFDETVAGLDIGAPVRFRGVPLGQVTAIGLSTIEYELGLPPEKRRNYIIVRARITLERYRVDQLSAEIAGMIKQGLRAQTELAGITGQQYLSLDLLDAAKYPPLPFDWKPRYLYIPSAPSLTREIVANVQSFLAHLDRTDVQALARNVNALVSTLNLELKDLSLGELTRDTAAAVRQARQTLATVDRVLSRPETDAMVADLARVSRRLDELLADPGLKKTVDNLALGTDGLRRVATSGDIERALRGMDELAQRLNGMARDNSYDVRLIVQDLKVTADNLRVLSDALRRNPAGALLGGPPERVPLPFGRAP